MENRNNKTALITGASKGLGFALAVALAKNNWNLIITARNASLLLETKNKLQSHTNVHALSGDVRDEVHLLEIAQYLDREKINLDVVVNNASALGPSPMVPLLDHPIDELHNVLHTNVIAPISLLQKIKNHLSNNSTTINISSDAAINAYEHWGGYGSSKTALDHMTQILTEENPEHRFFSFDPGDMNTGMHQSAFPGEDISDRPAPQDIAVPALISLINQNLDSGRYTTDSFKTQLA